MATSVLSHSDAELWKKVLKNSNYLASITRQRYCYPYLLESGQLRRQAVLYPDRSRICSHARPVRLCPLSDLRSRQILSRSLPSLCLAELDARGIDRSFSADPPGPDRRDSYRAGSRQNRRMAGPTSGHRGNVGGNRLRPV